MQPSFFQRTDGSGGGMTQVLIAGSHSGTSLIERARTILQDAKIVIVEEAAPPVPKLEPKSVLEDIDPCRWFE